MSDTVIIAILASIAPTLAAIGAIIIGILNSGKLTQIHTLTNSNLSTVTSSLQVANAKIEGLERLVSKFFNGNHQSEKKVL